MRTATIRQIRHDFSTVLSWLQEGEEVVILNRRRPVARLLPPRPEEAKQVIMPDFAARLARRTTQRPARLVEQILEERNSRP